jgi:hypothetical protein
LGAARSSGGRFRSDHLRSHHCVALVRAKVLGAYYSGENTSEKFKKIHHDHDAMIAHALASMNPALIPGAGDRIAAIRDAWTNTQEPWSTIETLDPRAPKAMRDKAVARWFESATAVVNRFVDLSRMETGEIRLTDPAIGELVTARQIGFAPAWTAAPPARQDRAPRQEERA